MEVVYFEAPAQEGPRPPQPGEPGYRPPSEPIINAPWPVAVLTLGIVALYALQTQANHDWVIDTFSLITNLPFAAWPGRLITSQFVHGSWAHALMNAGFILAFGAPVARFFGPSLKGSVGFFVFYLVCGVFAGLGFAALHLGQPTQLVGASGAASGLMGATARLIGGQGRVGPMFSQPVTGMGLSWIIVNVIMAFAGGLLLGGGGDVSVGWEAHLAGFAAGVLLIGPFARVADHR